MTLLNELSWICKWDGDEVRWTKCPHVTHVKFINSPRPTWRPKWTSPWWAVINWSASVYSNWINWRPNLNEIGIFGSGGDFDGGLRLIRLLDRFGIKRWKIEEFKGYRMVCRLMEFDWNWGRYLNFSEWPLSLSSERRRHFGDLGIDGFIVSNLTQKVVGRVFNQLSNGIFKLEIWLNISRVIDLEVSCFLVFSSFHLQLSTICISKRHLMDWSLKDETKRTSRAIECFF